MLAKALVLLLSLLLLPSGADARQLPSSSSDRRAVRGDAPSRSAASLVKSAAAVLARPPAREKLLFQAPRAEQRAADICDHEAADIVGAVSAGACSCM